PLPYALLLPGRQLPPESWPAGVATRPAELVRPCAAPQLAGAPVRVGVPRQVSALRPACVLPPNDVLRRGGALRPTCALQQVVALPLRDGAPPQPLPRWRPPVDRPASPNALRSEEHT